MTDPRTWATDDYVSAATLNTELRDRFRFLLGHSLNPKPHARVRSTVPVSLASKQWSTLTFDTTEVDRGGMFAGGAGSALVAPIAGRYRIGAAVSTDHVASNKSFRIIINAAREIVRKSRPGTGRPVPIEATVPVTVRLAAGDFIEVEVWHDYPTPINALPDTWAPVLWARWEGL